MFAWGRLGESREEASSRDGLRFLSADYLVQERHAAELRSSVAQMWPRLIWVRP